MQLSPRYDADPVIVLQFPPEEILEPLVRQRSRLATRLSEFTDEQWATPSRCKGWSNRDVIVHLESTNAFWSHSIEHGVRGAPTRLLATFDPVATPAEMVAASAHLGTSELLDRFSGSNQRLADLVQSLDVTDWAATAEAPPGHVSVSSVAHHALWDSWVHERDVLLPLGVEAEDHDDELIACLRYSAALGPSLAVVNGTARPVAMRIDAADPRPPSRSRYTTASSSVRIAPRWISRSPAGPPS